MVLVSYFVLNLFCGFFPCEYNYDEHLAARQARSDSAVFTRRSAVVPPAPPVLVELTAGGHLEGFTLLTAKRREIFGFEAVPYAEAPIGDLRFRAPNPKRPWKGVLRAKGPGVYCAQMNVAKIPQILGKEDCLVLNIYTPKISRGNSTIEINLPVIVYFHGGAFTVGGGHEVGPAYLLDQDVVLVTVNYRLGVLGFLSTSDSSSPGNYGLKDQVLALKWINQNIHHFGGNKSLVTLFGGSAGAASVHLHMLANRTREYFSAGISFSGNAFNPWVIQPPALTPHVNGKLAKLTRCPLAATNSKGFVNCLRKINVFSLVEKQDSVYDSYSLPAVIFGPVIEKPGPDAFLTEDPHQTYSRNATAKYPWINSNVHDECDAFIMLLETFGMMKPLMRKWSNVSTLILDYKYRVSPALAQALSRNISEFYFGKDGLRPGQGHLLSQLWSDRYFNFPSHEAVAAHSNVAPTYSSVFGYKGKQSAAGYLGLDRVKWGVAHGEDEFYVFNRSVSFPSTKTSDPDYGVVKFLTGVIANFAKTREPFYIDELGSKIQIWKPVSSDSTKIARRLSITSKIKMMDEPHQDRFKFWRIVHASADDD